MQLDDPLPSSFLDPARVRLTRVPDVPPVLTVDGQTYEDVRVRLAFPLSDERKYVAFFDADDAYIGMIIDVTALDAQSQQVVDDELRWRYFTPRIVRINRMWSKSDRSYLDVETDRGATTIAFKGIRDHIAEIAPGRIVITDDHGNRYEIRDVHHLDRRSRRLIRAVV
ncbi:MAG: DUF1854 domain-containing protein [Candidatus Latescibacteria bacterium]|nr:DUF1854 domain-containing protein [Candidatus Latescibacterota bacterium]